MGNLEADVAKLLQFILLGQPQLRDRLAQPQLRQLRQRLFRSFHLAALSSGQTADYIRHRLAVAGAKTQLFTPDAMDLIHRCSGGLPRVINQLCDGALLTAYGQSRKEVTRHIVQVVARELIPGQPGDLAVDESPPPSAKAKQIETLQESQPEQPMVAQELPDTLVERSALEELRKDQRESQIGRASCRERV